MHLPAVLPLHTCHTQLICTQKWPKWQAGFSGKRFRNFSIRTTVVQSSVFLQMVWRCMMINLFYGDLFWFVLALKKSWHISPFGGCGVEEEGGLDDGGDGLGDEGEEEGGVGGRPGGEAPQKPGSSPQQSHSCTNFNFLTLKSKFYPGSRLCPRKPFWRQL